MTKQVGHSAGVRFGNHHLRRCYVVFAGAQKFSQLRWEKGQTFVKFLWSSSIIDVLHASNTRDCNASCMCRAISGMGSPILASGHVMEFES